MADKTNVYNQITALRRETAKNAVSPNSLGAILKSIVDLIDGTVNNAQLDTGSGDSDRGNQSHGFNGLVEDDTFSPLVISSQTVQLPPSPLRGTPSEGEFANRSAFEGRKTAPTLR